MEPSSANAAHHYSQVLVEKIQSIIDKDPKVVGPITKWGLVLDILKVHKIAYVVEDIDPDMMLVHPDNRSKLGVNPFNAHRVGAYIHRVGADMELLTKATCSELSPIEATRKRQIDFNHQLVSSSAGMLAPVSGAERYVSLGCGHTAQFIKAVRANCTTPQPSIADDSGRLNIQRITKDDPNLKRMIERGWSWTVLPWQCEVAWPRIADLAQSALNASNSVASQQSELEAASTIAEYAHVQASQDKPIDWDACISAAHASMPPCAGYLNILGTYVRLYGGGVGAPMVKYLDEFSKAFGENRRLGEEFLTVVTETSFNNSSVTKRHPHIRTGLLATNLTSPKVVDGVARLLVKSDVERLKHKSQANRVDEAEETMRQGWELVASLANKQQAYPALGRLHTRTILHLTAKAKSGFEKTCWSSFSAILDEFKGDLAKAVSPTGVDDELSPRAASGLAASSGSPLTQQAVPPSSTSTVVNISDLSDPVWVAKQAGFEIGMLFFERAVGPSKGIYKTTDISKSGQVELAAVTMYPAKHQTVVGVTVEITDFLRKWTRYKGELPARLSPMEEHSPAGSEHLKLERKRTQVFTALLDTAMGHDERLLYSMHPTELRANTDIPKGELELTPVTDLKCIKTKRSGGSADVSVRLKKDTFYLSEPPRARHVDPTEWNSDVVFAPFWWVGTTSNPESVNMVEKKITDKKTGLSFTGLVNSRSIDKHDRILVFKAKRAEPVPLAGVASKRQRSAP